MLTIDPKTAEAKKLYGYLTGAVGPRPIAFASTMDQGGIANLSPFSFFNVFSANPPILVFSPVRKGRDGSIKHTLQNVEATKEVVINIVNYAMVQQMSLSSTEYGEGIDEFIKSGLTKEKSDLVKPFRVRESPVQFECTVNEIVHLGKNGGAGNLVICEVVKVHIKEDILDEKGHIDQYKIDQVARMGGNMYTRANKGLFEVPKPLDKTGMGVDAIPEKIRTSHVLTGNDLGKLGNVEALPADKEVEAFAEKNNGLRNLSTKEVHAKAQKLLEEDNTAEAWKMLLAATKNI